MVSTAWWRRPSAEALFQDLGSGGLDLRPIGIRGFGQSDEIGRHEHADHSRQLEQAGRGRIVHLASGGVSGRPTDRLADRELESVRIGSRFGGDWHGSDEGSPLKPYDPGGWIQR